jgi:hypothetical protein
LKKKVGGETQGTVTSGKMLMNFDGGKKKGEVGVPLLNEADEENKSRETVGASWRGPNAESTSTARLVAAEKESQPPREGSWWAAAKDWSI